MAIVQWEGLHKHSREDFGNLAFLFSKFKIQCEKCLYLFWPNGKMCVGQANEIIGKMISAKKGQVFMDKNFYEIKFLF
jgi:hypothetical protein